MPTTPKFAHIVLQTNQLAAMRQWYCRVLDAHVVHEKGALCFITFDDEHHRIALFHPPFQLPARTPMMVGLAHSAYTFPTLEALAEKYEALKNAGITQRVPVQHGVTTSLYYRDPDGDAVELQIDNWATPDAPSSSSAPSHSAACSALPYGRDRLQSFVHAAAACAVARPARSTADPFFRQIGYRTVASHA
jgi:catechol 2,3-dioxygenase-like lactoylglutathione lyase family enzyme